MKDSEFREEAAKILFAFGHVTQRHEYMPGVSAFLEGIIRSVLLLAQVIQEKPNN